MSLIWLLLLVWILSVSRHRTVRFTLPHFLNRAIVSSSLFVDISLRLTEPRVYWANPRHANFELLLFLKGFKFALDLNFLWDFLASLCRLSVVVFNSVVGSTWTRIVVYCLAVWNLNQTQLIDRGDLFNNTVFLRYAVYMHSLHSELFYLFINLIVVKVR